MTGYGGFRGLSVGGAFGPIGLLLLVLFWQHLVVLAGFAYLALVVYALLKGVWEDTPWHQRRAERERRVHLELLALRKAEFERRHGVPMPDGYGYRYEVKPGRDWR